MKKTLFVVVYNHDNNTNSPDKELMAIVENREEFYDWLKLHNNSRRRGLTDNNVGEREFDLIPLELFNS